MSYDIHITRQQKVGQCISEEEWQTLVGADPGLKLEGEVKAQLPFGEELVYTNLLLTLWSGHPMAFQSSSTFGATKSSSKTLTIPP